MIILHQFKYIKSSNGRISRLSTVMFGYLWFLYFMQQQLVPKSCGDEALGRHCPTQAQGAMGWERDETGSPLPVAPYVRLAKGRGFCHLHPRCSSLCRLRPTSHGAAELGLSRERRGICLVGCWLPVCDTHCQAIVYLAELLIFLCWKRLQEGKTQKQYTSVEPRTHTRCSPYIENLLVTDVACK